LAEADHFSRPAVTHRLQQPTRDFTDAGRASSLLGLAPGGVYRATPVARGAVVSYTTVSPLPVRLAAPSAVCSLLHFPSPCDARPLAGTLPCGARTFLPRRERLRRSTLSATLSNNSTAAISVKCARQDSNLKPPDP